jgi:hypothetical protein
MSAGKRFAYGARSALLSGGAIAIIGAMAMLAHQPLLFPSLGPTVFLKVVTPKAPTARHWNTICGHAIGLCAAYAALSLCGASPTAGVMDANGMTLARVTATSLAVGMTIGLQLVLKAQHAPAVATTMLIALGALKADAGTAVIVMTSVILISALASLARLGRPVPQKYSRAAPVDG